MADKYLVSVGEARGFDTDGNLLFLGKTLLDSSIDIKVSSQDVRGGYGAPLLYTYFHSSDANITITDAQWNLAYLALQAGGTISTGKDIFTKETITLSGTTGTVSKTPLADVGTNIYAWLELADGTTERVVVSNSTKQFTSSQTDGEVVCYYYANDPAARTFTVPSNIVPKIIKLVLDVQLASSGSNENIVGKVQFVVNRASLTGNFQIQQKMDSVASSPLNVRVLADFTSGTGKFMDVTETLTSSNWYDTAIALSIVGGDFSIPVGGGTHTIVVKAIHSDNSVSTPPVADLDFTSGTGGTCTIGANTGVVTPVGAGTSLIRVVIHSKNTIEASCTATVTS